MAPSAVLEAFDHVEVTSQSEPICQVVSPTGMMGYGFNEEWTEAALAELTRSSIPTAIILDSGSTDSGPSKLALGTTTCPRSAYERDFRKLLKLSVKYKTPIMMSSAGGDGSDVHVDFFLDIVRNIADEEANRFWKLKSIAIYSQLDASLVEDRLEAGKITGCGSSVPGINPATIRQTPCIVAQMGPEPLLDAMNANPDFHVMITGRAYDPAPFIAFAAYHLLESKQRDITMLSPEALGAIAHMGKILECGGLCATPKGLGALGVVNRDLSIDVRPLDPNAKCIPLSVAAHTLYEKTRPDLLAGPGGVLDVSSACYVQLDDGVTTRVQGSLFYLSHRQNQPYTVKLEGARVAGFRTLVMGSFSDPGLIIQIHTFLVGAKEFVSQQYGNDHEWDIGFHVYGLDKGQPQYIPSQVFVVAEVLARSQDEATTLASALRVHFAHGSYPGQKATSGNFGMGIGGRFELETGECTEFSIYHLLSLAPEEEHASDFGQSKGLFRWRSVLIGRGELQDYSLDPEIDRVALVAQEKEMSAPVAQQISDTPRVLLDVAKVVRSKNAGPFEITLDVVFDNSAIYQAVKAANILTRKTVADLYCIPETEIVWAGFFDVAMAFKATVPRRRNGQPSCSGGFMEDDVHGSQKSAPLAGIFLPQDLQEGIIALQAN